MCNHQEIVVQDVAAPKELSLEQLQFVVGGGESDRQALGNGIGNMVASPINSINASAAGKGK